MPIVVPPFVQYQSPLVPLRGLWNHVPPEGDRFVQAEIDWGITTGLGMAVQFALSGNSPVAISQIAALNVDNARNAADVQFLFPDSGFQLVIPAYAQALAPVLTNALMFYATCPLAQITDITIFQVLNSIPPPIQLAPSVTQQSNGVSAISLATPASTQVIPVGVTGTLQNAQITVITSGTAGQGVTVELIDGRGQPLWISGIGTGSNIDETLFFTLGPVNLTFVNGLQFRVLTSTMTGGTAVVNVYYAVP